MDARNLREVAAHLKALDARYIDNAELSTPTYTAGWTRSFHKYYTSLPRLHIDARVQHDTEFVTLANGIEGEWVVQRQAVENVRILYLHGGGWCAGDPALYRSLSAYLAHLTYCPVLLGHYRTAPRDPYPASLADCLALYSQILIHGPAHASTPASVYVVGDSAGANLALALSLAVRERELPMPKALVLISPITDCATEGDLQSHSLVGSRWLRRCIAQYLNEVDPSLPTVSPIHAGLDRLPSTLIMIGGTDPVRDDAIRFADRARHLGLSVELDDEPHMPHAYPRFFNVLPQARAALNRIAHFITQQQDERAAGKNIIDFKRRQRHTTRA